MSIHVTGLARPACLKPRAPPHHPDVRRQCARATAPPGQPQMRSGRGLETNGFGLVGDVLARAQSQCCQLSVSDPPSQLEAGLLRCETSHARESPGAWLADRVRKQGGPLARRPLQMGFVPTNELERWRVPTTPARGSPFSRPRAPEIVHRKHEFGEPVHRHLVVRHTTRPCLPGCP